MRDWGKGSIDGTDSQFGSTNEEVLKIFSTTNSNTKMYFHEKVALVKTVP